MSRIAIVDVGTNTTRLLIADLQDGRIVAQPVRLSRVTRLGAGVDRTGRLADDALDREHAVLADYRARITAHGVDRAVAVMTSAVRDAANGLEFSHEAAFEYNLDVHILTGDQEGKLTYRGATDELPAEAATERVLVVDIGGGSTELVTGTGPTPGFHVSTQAGVVRQADRHIDHDPPTAEELAAVAADVRETLEQAVPPAERAGIERAIAVAGTSTSLAAIAQELEPYDPTKVHGYRLTAPQIEAIMSRLAPMSLEQRQQVTGLHPDRAVVILPGTVILTEVMRLFGLDAVEVSEHDILRGAALYFSA
jgi:exopolyphosphatase / guanosine-5'-triphosphate,3'-diphosphate pyrophosphatase